jgi:hypothetical protein
MGLMLIMLLVLPLFRAEPMLGPIYVHSDHFMPPDFPLLLVVPALLIDLVMQRVGRGRDWRLSAAIAVIFVAAMVAAQWPFGTSAPWADWFFIRPWHWRRSGVSSGVRWRLTTSHGLPIVGASVRVRPLRSVVGNWMSRNYQR